AGEGEGGRGAWSEWIAGIGRICGDEVAEVFVEKKIVGFEDGFSFVAVVMHGDGGVDISLFEVVAQEGSDGPGAAVGVEVVRVIAHHAANIGEDVRRKDVLVGRATHRLEIASGLEL